MLELPKKIIASNLTVAAAIRDAAMTIKVGGATISFQRVGHSDDYSILTNLEKQSLGKECER